MDNTTNINMNTILAKQNSNPIYCSIAATVNMKKTLNPVGSAGLMLSSRQVHSLNVNHFVRFVHLFPLLT